MPKKLTLEEKQRRSIKKQRHSDWLRRERARKNLKKEQFASVKKAQHKNTNYEGSLKKFVSANVGWEEPKVLELVDNQKMYHLFRYTFPYKHSSTSGKTIKPKPGFSKKVALDFINRYVRYQKAHSNADICDILKTHAKTGKEFVDSYYIDGVHDLSTLMGIEPGNTLSNLFNDRTPRNTAIGSGEYALKFLLKDAYDADGPDIHTKSKFIGEVKSEAARAAGAKISDVKNMDAELPKEYTMLGKGPIKVFNYLNILYGPKEAIRLMASYKCRTYQDTDEEIIQRYITEMSNNYNRFINSNGELNLDKFNASYDLYIYPINENFTHIVLFKKPTKGLFNVEYKLFSKEKFETVDSILNMIESGELRAWGEILNDNRDKAVHIGI